MSPRLTITTLFPYTTLFRSDFATVAAVLQEAERYQMLEQMILEINQAYIAQDDATTEQGNAEIVRHLLRKHVPSGLPVGEEARSEEHTSELQSHSDLVCRLL